MNPNKYETMYLDQYLLPKYAKLRELTQPNAAKNVTLDGQMYVDFYNNRRVWEVSWQLLTVAEYDSIRAKYNKQFSQQRMLMFIVNDLNIFVPVYINISDKNIRFSGQYVEGFSITLEEQYAIS